MEIIQAEDEEETKVRPVKTEREGDCKSNLGHRITSFSCFVHLQSGKREVDGNP